MSTFRSAWTRATANRWGAVGSSSVIVVVGIVLIAVGAIADWGWTRIVGAGMISTGALFAGILIGWSEPIRPRVAEHSFSWSSALIVLLATILVAPMLIGLVMMFGGAILGAASAAWYLVLLGVLMTLVFIALTAGTITTALSLALRGLWRSGSGDSAGSNGRGPG